MKVRPAASAASKPAQPFFPAGGGDGSGTNAFRMVNFGGGKNKKRQPGKASRAGPAPTIFKKRQTTASASAAAGGGVAGSSGGSGGRGGAGRILRREDRLAIRDYTKGMGLDKAEAVMRHVANCRQGAAAGGVRGGTAGVGRGDEMEDGRSDTGSMCSAETLSKASSGIFVSPNQMPWCPDLSRAYALAGNSSLPHADHRRYVAIISNFLRPDVNFRFEYNKQELGALDEILANERKEFETRMIDSVAKEAPNKSVFNWIPRGAYELFKARQLRKYAQIFRNDQVAFGTSSSPHLASSQLIVYDESSPKANSNGSGGMPHMETGGGAAWGAAGPWLKVAQEPLQSGSLLKVLVPDMQYKCKIPLDAELVAQYLSEEDTDRVPIDEDAKLMEMGLFYHVDHLMDASTLRHLMCNPWEHRNQHYAVKVSMLRRSHEGTTRRLIVFSKPVLCSPLHSLHTTRQFLKWALKAELRDAVLREREKTELAKQERNRRIAEKKHELSLSHRAKAKGVVVGEGSSKMMKAERNGNDEDDEEGCGGGLCIMEVDTEAQNNPQQQQVKLEVAPGEDLLGNILGTMDQCDALFKAPKPPTPSSAFAASPQTTQNPSTSASSANPVADLLQSFFGTSSATPTSNAAASPQLHNLRQEATSSAAPMKKSKRYAVVNLEPNSTTTKHQIIIRSTNHGRDQSGQRISLTVKAEYLPEIGAENLQYEEQLWNTLTGLLKGSEQHLNFRLHPHTGHCLQMERKNSRLSPANCRLEVKQMLSERTARMRKLLDTLGQLDYGDYLLLPPHEEEGGENGAWLKIVPQRSGAAEIAPFAAGAARERDNGGTLGGGMEEEKWGEANTALIPTATVVNASSLTQLCFGSGQPLRNVNLLDNWNGVDYHLPLQWQIVRGWIPGCYPPTQPQAQLQKQIGGGGSRSSFTSGRVFSPGKRHDGANSMSKSKPAMPQLRQPPTSKGSVGSGQLSHSQQRRQRKKRAKGKGQPMTTITGRNEDDGSVEEVVGGRRRISYEGPDGSGDGSGLFDYFADETEEPHYSSPAARGGISSTTTTMVVGAKRPKQEDTKMEEH